MFKSIIVFLKKVGSFLSSVFLPKKNQSPIDGVQSHSGAPSVSKPVDSPKEKKSSNSKSLRCPQVLLFADEDLVGGLNRQQTYYPEIKRQVDLGNLMVAEYSNSHLFKIDTPPVADGSDLYVYNKYSGVYIKSTSQDLLNKLIEDQSIAVKETLVRMGAKHIVISEGQHNADKSKIKGDADVKTPVTSVKVNSELSWNRSVDVDSKVEYENDQNRACKPSEVEQFMASHGMTGDTKLELLLDRMKSVGSLSGTETYEVSYLSEVDNAISVSLKINARIFSSKLNFESLHQHEYRIKKVLKVTF